MKSYKNVINETKEIVDFRALIDVYEEIAAGKLLKIRTTIISVRDFYEGLRELSLEVGSDFQSVLKHEEPTEAALFIAANGGLYGDIMQKTFQLFLSYVRQHHTRNFVAGALGIQFMSQYAKGVDFVSVPLPEDAGIEPISAILQQLVSFHKISVFYSKFQNIVVQEPLMGEVSGKMFPQGEEDLKALAKAHMRYIYEPAVYPVSEVFTKEILKEVLEQLVLESQLARLASRVMHLDQAIDKSDLLIKKLVQEKQKIKKQMLEKKQNAMITKIMRRSFAL